MTEKDKLIIKLQDLYNTHHNKCNEERERRGDPPEIGYLTKEGFEIACLYTEMIRLGVQPEDYVPSGNKPLSAYDAIP